MADETREAVLAAVDELADHGGLSLRPAALPTSLPNAPSDVPHEQGTRGRLEVGADAGQLARILVPAGLLALVAMLVLAGLVTLVGFTVGILAAVGVALVGMVGVGAVGAFVVTRLARRATVGPAALSWESSQPWPVSLAQSAERRLVFVAVDVVARIAQSPAWASPSLDLAAELDEIDAQAYRLAQAEGEVHRQGWDALVDRVSALSDYADRLAVLETEPAPTMDDPHLLAGSARDELATDHVRRLTREITPPESHP